MRAEWLKIADYDGCAREPAGGREFIGGGNSRKSLFNFGCEMTDQLYQSAKALIDAIDRDAPSGLISPATIDAVERGIAR